jgi:tRNA(fMet)-specific endonuclease VapC
MNKVIIDTNVYSNAMRGDEKAARIIQTYRQILLSPVVIGELLAGFRRGSQEGKNSMQLKDFLSRDRIVVLSITGETADFYSFILTNLKAQGTPVPVNDIWIAASAMETGSVIATSDIHFSHIKGIEIINP